MFHRRRSAHGRYCCKSLFAVLIKNSPGYRRDFRVKMWGTSSPDNKLTGDFGSVIEATQSGDCRLIRIIAKKISPGNFRLLQQYRSATDFRRHRLMSAWRRSGCKTRDKRTSISRWQPPHRGGVRGAEPDLAALASNRRRPQPRQHVDSVDRAADAAECAQARADGTSHSRNL